MAIITQPPFSGNYFRLWAPQWNTGPSDVFNTADQQGAAADNEINVWAYQQLGTPTQTAANRSASITAMKAVNPNGTHCAYVNGTFGPAGQKPNTGPFLTVAYHPTFDHTYPFLTDSGATWLMDPRSPEWTFKSHGTARSVPDEANARRSGVFTSPHLDGVMVDNLGTGVIGSSYNNKDTGDGSGSGGSYAAQNTDVGVAWNDPTQSARWLQLTTGIAAAVNGAYNTDGGATLAFFVNGADKGSTWFDANGPTSVLANYGQLVMFESWVRNARDALNVYKSEADWVLDCNAMLDLENRGRGALMFTKIWAGSPHAGHVNNGASPTATSSSNDDNDLSTIVIPHRLCAASFMLCTRGRSFFHFRHDSVGGTERIPKDRWYAHINNLGDPIEEWNASISADGTTGGIKNAQGTGGAANIYSRRFTNGVVVVNPTGAGANNVYDLPAGTYTDVDASTYSTSVTVDNTARARILVKQ